MSPWFEKKFEKNNSPRRVYSLKRSASSYMPYTYILIIINVVAFLFSWIILLTLGEDFFYDNIALTPIIFFSGYIWTIFTSMFSHTLPFHIFANMLSLFFLGMFVERLIGRKRFLYLYLISGLFAGLFFAATSYYLGSIGGVYESLFMNPNIPALGASGAVFGLIGLLAILTPRTKVSLILGPLIAIIISFILFPIAQELSIDPGLVNLISLLINGYIILSLFSIISFNERLRRIALPVEMNFKVLPFVAIVPLIIIGLYFPLPIGNTAHLGGLIVGILYGLYLKQKYPRKAKMISSYFSR